MTRARRRAPRTVILAAAAAAAAGMATAACGGGLRVSPLGRDPGEPWLADLRFAGQAVDSPLVLLLEADFEDEDGDLAGGGLETFINQRATSAGRMPLLPIFLQSDVDQGAVSGTLDFVLELSFADGPPPDGTSFSLGARLVDEAGNMSTTAELHLTLEEGG